MRDNVGSVCKFLDALQASAIYDSALPEKGSLREDVLRLKLLADAVLAEKALSDHEAKDLEAAKSSLLKNKQGVFHNAASVFPLGAFLMEASGILATEHWQDQLLEKDLSSASDFAAGLTCLNVDSNSPNPVCKPDGEIAVPSQSKVSWIQITITIIIN